MSSLMHIILILADNLKLGYTKPILVELISNLVNNKILIPIKIVKSSFLISVSSGELTSETQVDAPPGFFYKYRNCQICDSLVI